MGVLLRPHRQLTDRSAGPWLLVSLAHQNQFDGVVGEDLGVKLLRQMSSDHQVPHQLITKVVRHDSSPVYVVFVHNFNEFFLVLFLFFIVLVVFL